MSTQSNTPETETFMQFLQGLPSKGWDEFALLVEEKVSQLERQRDAAIAEAKELREELADVRKVATECLDELQTAETVYCPRDHAPYWRWETTGEAVAGVEWDVTKTRAALDQARK